MDPLLPTPDWLDEQWSWDYAKLQMSPDDLFTTLHERFNTRVVPIQDPQAFHADVFDCADSATTREGFFQQLGERSAKRIEELKAGWEDVSSILGAKPRLWEGCARCRGWPTEMATETIEARPFPGCEEETLDDTPADRWAAFCQLSKTASFDSMVRFFDGYVRDERRRKAELRRQSDALLDKLMSQKKNKSTRRRCARQNGTAAAATTPSTPKIPESDVRPSSSPQHTPTISSDNNSPTKTAFIGDTGDISLTKQDAPDSSDNKSSATADITVGGDPFATKQAPFHLSTPHIAGNAVISPPESRSPSSSSSSPPDQNIEQNSFAFKKPPSYYPASPEMSPIKARKRRVFEDNGLETPECKRRCKSDYNTG